MSLFGVQTIEVQPGQTSLGVIVIEAKQLHIDMSLADSNVEVLGLDGSFVQAPEELQYRVCHGTNTVTFRHLDQSIDTAFRINCPGQVDRVMQSTLGSVAWFVRAEDDDYGWTNGDDQ